MTVSKSLVVALMFIAGSCGLARAQQGPATVSYPARQVNGVNGGYYAPYPNSVNYGLSGTFPNYGGYGYNGFGPGAQFGAHYATTGSTVSKQTPAPALSVPKTDNNLGGLAYVIQKQVGKPTKTTTRSYPRTRSGR